MLKAWSSADGTLGSYKKVQEVAPSWRKYLSEDILGLKPLLLCLSAAPLCAPHCDAQAQSDEPIDHQLKLLKPKQNLYPFICLGQFASVTEN